MFKINLSVQRNIILGTHPLIQNTINQKLKPITLSKLHTTLLNLCFNELINQINNFKFYFFKNKNINFKLEKIFQKKTKNNLLYHLQPL